MLLARRPPLAEALELLIPVPEAEPMLTDGGGGTTFGEFRFDGLAPGNSWTSVCAEVACDPETDGGGGITVDDDVDLPEGEPPRFELELPHRGWRWDDIGGEGCAGPAGIARDSCGAGGSHVGRRRDDILRTEKFADDAADERSVGGLSWRRGNDIGRGRAKGATFQTTEVARRICGRWRSDDGGRGQVEFRGARRFAFGSGDGRRDDGDCCSSARAEGETSRVTEDGAGAITVPLRAGAERA